jgi:hypothetical protein
MKNGMKIYTRPKHRTSFVKTNAGRYLHPYSSFEGLEFLDGEQIIEGYFTQKLYLNLIHISRNLKRVYIDKISHVDMMFCPSLEKVCCRGVDIMMIDYARPEIIGRVHELEIYGKFPDFPNLEAHYVNLKM